MEAMEQLLLACHCQSINLLVESFLSTLRLLLEADKPHLHILATNSVSSIWTRVHFQPDPGGGPALAWRVTEGLLVQSHCCGVPQGSMLGPLLFFNTNPIHSLAIKDWEAAVLRPLLHTEHHGCYIANQPRSC